MSERAYARISTATTARNQQRYRAAEAALQAKGYVFVDDEVLYATLTETTRDRCVRADASRALEDAKTTIHVIGQCRAGHPAPVAIELRVSELEACRFLQQSIHQLDGVRTDGSAVRTRIIAIDRDLRLARDRNGALVIVEVSRRAVSRREVLVKRSCDHMPSPGEPSLERQLHARVVLALAPPPRIEMVVEEEVLDVECTENTY